MDDHPRSNFEDSGLQVVPEQDIRQTAASRNHSSTAYNANEKIPSYPGDGDYKWDHSGNRKFSTDKKGYYSPPRDSTYPEVLATAGHSPMSDAEASGYPRPPPAQKRILGLRRRWFAVIVVVLIAIIALGVGLGVYFGRHTNRTQAASNQNPDSAAESTLPSPASASATASITTQTIALPSATLLSDCPSSNNSIHSVNVNGQSFDFRKACGVSLYNPADPTANVTGSAESLDECINRCASANSGGPTRCDRVCWKNSKTTTQDGGAGNCYGYIGTNTTDGSNHVVGDFSGTTNCDGAFLIATSGSSSNSI